MVPWCWWGFWETDHFFGAPGSHKNCSPNHLKTHERGLGGKESPDVREYEKTIKTESAKR